jgi:hypothetical protein
MNEQLRDQLDFLAEVVEGIIAQAVAQGLPAGFAAATVILAGAKMLARGVGSAAAAEMLRDMADLVAIKVDHVAAGEAVHRERFDA